MLTGSTGDVSLTCTLMSPIATILLLIGNLFATFGLTDLKSALAAFGGQLLTLAGCP